MQCGKRESVECVCTKLWERLRLEAPVDLKSICDHFGIGILRRDIRDLTCNISAVYAKNGRRAVILVNIVDSLWQQRASIAHEIYHHIQMQNMTAIHGRICILRSVVSDDEAERQCDRFAIELLMPRKLVSRWHYDLQYNPEFRLAILADRFGVSEDMMQRRIAELKLPKA